MRDNRSPALSGQSCEATPLVSQCPSPSCVPLLGASSLSYITGSYNSEGMKVFLASEFSDQVRITLEQP